MKKLFMVLSAIVLLAPAAEAAAAVKPSANNTTLTSSTGTITDTGGHEWKLVESEDTGLQISRDGVTDANSANVTLLMISNGIIYQQASLAHMWWYWKDSPPGWIQVKR